MEIPNVTFLAKALEQSHSISVARGVTSISEIQNIHIWDGTQLKKKIVYETKLFIRNIIFSCFINLNLFKIVLIIT